MIALYLGNLLQIFLVGQRNLVYYNDQDDDLADITMDTGRRERKH